MMQNNPLPDVTAPSRAEVDACWLALIDGRVSRSAVHEWTVKWVESESLWPIQDPMVRNALQHLHGFDLVSVPGQPGTVRHSLSGPYLRSLFQVAQEYKEWRRNCDVYDADPEGYMRSAKERARREMAHLEAREDDS